MIEPGSVKAGDELVYVFGNRVKCRKIAKVNRITQVNSMVAGSDIIYGPGVIIIDNGSRFTPEGIGIGKSMNNTEELQPLTSEIRKEIESGQY